MSKYSSIRQRKNFFKRRLLFNSLSVTGFQFNFDTETRFRVVKIRPVACQDGTTFIKERIEFYYNSYSFTKWIKRYES